MTNHVVSDCIIRIKNAALAHRRKVSIPYSRMSLMIGNVLVKERFLTSVNEVVEENKKKIIMDIAYYKGTPLLTNVRVISKPSLRVYMSKEHMMTNHKNKLKKVVVTTSQGIMVAKEAMQKGIGGEILFEIW